jgi:transposase InsO family protein
MADRSCRPHRSPNQVPQRTERRIIGLRVSRRLGPARPYRTETERRAALPDWLHTYNNHRGHTALGGHPPASRVPNLSGQYT